MDWSVDTDGGNDVVSVFLDRGRRIQIVLYYSPLYPHSRTSFAVDVFSAHLLALVD